MLPAQMLPKVVTFRNNFPKCYHFLRGHFGNIWEQSCYDPSESEALMTMVVSLTVVSSNKGSQTSGISTYLGHDRKNYYIVPLRLQSKLKVGTAHTFVI